MSEESDLPEVNDEPTDLESTALVPAGALAQHETANIVSPIGQDDAKRDYHVSAPEYAPKIVRAIDPSEAIRAYREASGITGHVKRYDCEPA